MAEEDRMLRTPDEKVRRQIEAVKSQLRHHFRNVEDAPAIQSAAFDGLHTISMVTGGHRPVLQLEYAWLEEHQRSEVLKALRNRCVIEHLKKPETCKVVVKSKSTEIIHA